MMDTEIEPSGRRLKVSEYTESIRIAVEPDEDKIFHIATLIKSIGKNGGRVWIFGNGGALAIAQHFAQDLVKLCGIRAHASFDASLITAYSNDRSFEYSFYGPLAVLGGKNDLIVVFSCSGKSRNYIEFTTFPLSRLVAIVGTDGGFLKDKAEVCMHVRSDDYQICETSFCVISDLIVKQLIEEK